MPLIKKVNWRLPGQRKEAGANKEPMVTKSEEELALDKEAAAAIRKGMSLGNYRQRNTITHYKI